MDKKVDGIIYKATCKTNGKIYIGQTIKSLYMRKQAHKYRAFKGDRRSAFQIALLDEGLENFKWEILIAVESQDELDRWEKYYIKKYKANNSKYGYNSTDGGIKTVFNESVRKKMSIAKQNMTNETKLKMSVARKGKNNPNYGKQMRIEQRNKISDSLKGRKLSKSVCVKLSLAHKGKKHTLESCLKMRQIARRRSLLTEKDIKNIRKALKNGIQGKELSIKYNTTPFVISRIKLNKTWKEII
jgi:group I intron endonuclease